MAIFRTKTHWFLLSIFVITLFSVPLFFDSYWIAIFNFTGISVVAMLGLHILTGLCGQLSLGHAAFLGVGAYTTALLNNTFGLPIWMILIASGLTSACIGVIFGLPALKVKGFYLAMSTLAAQFIMIWVFIHMKPLTGGTAGMHVDPPQILGMVIDSDGKCFYLIMVVAFIMGFLAQNITRTRAGRAFMAIRDNDTAAEIMGVGLLKNKLLAFSTGCFYAGVAGSLWAYATSYIHPEHFGLKDSVWFLGMLIIGGVGSPLGAIFGTIFIKMLDVFVDNLFVPAFVYVFPGAGVQANSALSVFFFGLVIVVSLVKEPRGLAHRWEIFKRYYRLWPYSY